mgnify:CR=1 FL=1
MRRAARRRRWDASRHSSPTGARSRRSTRSSRRRRPAAAARWRSPRLAVGNPISRPRAAPRDDGAVDEIVVAEQGARLVDAPLGDRAGGCRVLLTTKSLVADRRRSSRRGTRSGRRACAARENVPARSCPNRKLAPTQTSTTCSHSTSTVRTNVSGSHARHLAREPDDRHALHARAAQRLEPLLRRHQQRRRLVGPDDARRMGIEGHRRGRAAAFARAPAHAIDDLRVAAVQAVEVPEREHGLVPAQRRVVRIVGDHRSCNTRPS